MVTLTELKYLVAVAEHGHFGRAAEACNISQPTLSMQLKKLEELLGGQLFERTNKSCRITPMGEAILGTARRVLAGAEEIRAIARKTEPLCGTLRLGAIPTLAPYMLPWLLPPLGTAYPDLRPAWVENLTARLLEGLRNQSIDAAFLALPLGEPGIVEVPLFEEPFWVACAPDHRLARADAVGPHDLKGETVLCLTEGHCLRDQMIALCSQSAEAGGALGDFRLASLETVRQLVACGTGITLLPAMATPQALGVETGIVARPYGGAERRTIGLAFRETYPGRPDLELLADLVRRNLPSCVMPINDRIYQS